MLFDFEFDPSCEGKILCIELLPMQRCIFLKIAQGRLKILLRSDKSADAVIRATPLALMGLLKQTGNRLPPNVSISGDLHFAQAMKAALLAVEIDWEEKLSTIIGDVAAHWVGQQYRQWRRYGRKVNASITRNMRDYLQEESQLLLPRDELHDFFNAVDQLRNDVERLIARLHYVEQEANR